MTATASEVATLYIDGAWRSGHRHYERRDPAALDRITGRYTAAAPDDVTRAYDAADAARAAWSATPAPQRADVLRRAGDLLEARADEATTALIADMGKARRDARAEVLRSVAVLRYFAGELLQPQGETYHSADPSVLLMTVEQPLGVVCAITPWNFPWAIPMWKLAPAIGFGNAVVWKPAEAASGSACVLTAVLADAGLPNGVLNLLTGHGRELSGALTGDSRLAALTFTGSGGVGTRLRQAVADRNVKVQLELGGKNPAIVLADADLPDAAEQIARGAMLSTGQRCTATSRIYVDHQVSDDFSTLLRQAVERLVVGDPNDEATDVGPLASVEQREAVGHYLQAAAEEGASVIVGDLSTDPDSCFVAPTVVRDIRSDSSLLTEEIFGPLVVLAPVDGVEDAIARANDTEFGLSSAVFTRDLGTAMRFVRATESGLVHIDRETAGVEPHVPFGGVKGSSSMAREQGKAARLFFTTSKTVYLRAR